MKTKTFLLLCLFMGIGLTQLSAQNDRKAVKYSDDFDYWQPVECPGQEPDYLLGESHFSGIMHYTKDGVLLQQMKHEGTAESVNTGEVFEVKEIDMQYLFVTVTWHFNLKGNMGSHYLGTCTYDWATDITTIDKFVCVENGKK